MEKYKIYTSLVLSVTGAETDVQAVRVKIDNLSAMREMLLTARITNSATAPGAARTLIVNKYWSDYDIADANFSTIPTVLKGRKEATTALAVENTASYVNNYEVSGGIFRPKATYLFITLDKTAIDASSTLTLDLNLVKMRPVAS